MESIAFISCYRLSQNKDLQHSCSLKQNKKIFGMKHKKTLTEQYYQSTLIIKQTAYPSYEKINDLIQQIGKRILPKGGKERRYG
ncbi:hypothetical protein HanIR_Chr01g0029211 [Helianthus annuus]|nr:hypothetical protein HanIR_Chr01g0029211 [Helianthus annuus]